MVTSSFLPQEHNTQDFSKTKKVTMEMERDQTIMLFWTKTMKAPMISLMGVKNYERLVDFSLKHPFILCMALTVGFFSALPLLMFVGFTFFTLIIALFCFLCIEGSIIAIGGLVFVSVVSFITVFVAVFVSGIAISIWCLEKFKVLIPKMYFQTEMKVPKTKVEASKAKVETSKAKVETTKAKVETQKAKVEISKAKVEAPNVNYAAVESVAVNTNSATKDS